jgi:beta-glucosidase
MSVATVPRLDVVHPFLAADEAQSAYVQSFYQLFLGRRASANEVVGWLPLVRAGSTWQQMAAPFLVSPECYARCGNDPKQWVDYLYTTVCGRTADATGEASWLSRLTGGAAAVPSPISGAGAGGATWAQGELRNEQLLAQGHGPIVLAGDSITDGLTRGAGAPIWNESYAPLGAVNLAIPGLSTSEVLWQVQQGQFAAVSPRVLQLLIGTNNGGLYGHEADAVVAATADIVQGLLAPMPALRILLMGLLPRGLPGDSLRDWVTQVNARLLPLADREKVWFVDPARSFVGADGQLNAALYQPDRLHLTLAGYAALRAATLPLLLQLLRAS